MRLAIAVLSLCTLAGAQSPLGLQYPLGIPDMAVTGSAAAMGGSGTAVTDEFWGTSLNPANAGIGERSAFGALVSFDITTVNDDGSSGTVSGYAPKLLSLIIPIGRAGNLAFSMQKRYDANINYSTTEQKNDPYGYKSNTIKVSRKGGLTAWQAGWAYRVRKPASLFNSLSVGVTYERLYFNLETLDVFESVFSYNHESSQYSESMEELIIKNFASDALCLGLQVPVHPKVTLGFAAEYAFAGSGNGQYEREYYRVDTVALTKDEYDVTLPPSINIGIAYRPNDNWLFAADARSTLWDQYKNDFWPQSPQQTYGLAAGCRFTPAANKLSADYWQKINYSAGLRYSTLPHNGEGDGAQEIGFSLGLGLPIPNDGGIVDLVVDIGQRTDSRPKLAKYSENTVKIQLGINGGRNWFQRE